MPIDFGFFLASYAKAQEMGHGCVFHDFLAFVSIISPIAVNVVTSLEKNKVVETLDLHLMYGLPWTVPSTFKALQSHRRLFTYLPEI